ncbi:hypothetical protein BGZ60DRAFT_412051 [Tricladium varicosporioides]|nr:hypothetical protein BGZ60DRAFT_412051 [Hymenoscyphus varicosporioides]
MEQWDALHAMLICEELELRETISEDSQSSKQDPYIRGLRSPFLLKVNLGFASFIPALCRQSKLFKHPELVSSTYVPFINDPMLL